MILKVISIKKNPNGPKYSFGLGRDRMYKSFDMAGHGPAKYNPTLTVIS